ncbi:hypothetical protein B1M_32062, partial [Burkholderia sp. TJI49]
LAPNIPSVAAATMVFFMLFLFMGARDSVAAERAAC